MNFVQVLRTGALAAALSGLPGSPGLAADSTAESASPETWSIHAQLTFVEQYHPAFRSLYRGQNSLDPGSRGNETFDTTMYLGARLWDNAEVWADPEIDQGFGLSNTFGVAGFPNAEGSKVGKASPYFRLQRLFFRQTIDLGGAVEPIESGANQLGGRRASDNLIVTIGKFTATDIFDTNSYAHDPKSDFLNWSIVDAGAYDYAADAWGYTYGGTIEVTESWWTLRAGLFDLPRIPNGTELVRGFGQYELIAEAEERHELWGEPGKLKLLGFVNHGRTGSYADAVRLAAKTGSTPDTALVRRPASRPGASINIEQQLDDNIGLFARASLNDGSQETDAFTDIDKSISAGASSKGTAWDRANDTVGVAVAANWISKSARTYFAAGGLGPLIGDGRLTHAGTESILEVYYNARIAEGLTLSADYQYINNPAYNRDRGPVSVLGARIHAEI